jgi:hypothetical protein
MRFEAFREPHIEQIQCLRVFVVRQRTYSLQSLRGRLATAAEAEFSGIFWAGLGSLKKGQRYHDGKSFHARKRL